MMYGNSNIKFIVAKQAKEIYKPKLHLVSFFIYYRLMVHGNSNIK